MRARSFVVALFFSLAPPLALAAPAVSNAPSASAVPAAPLAPIASVAPAGSASSSLPKTKDWDKGTDVEIARRRPGCSARVLADWIRLRCPAPLARNVALVSGETNGFVAFVSVPYVDPKSYEPVDERKNGIEIIFPIRRGDRRLIVVNGAEDGYNGPIGRAMSIAISELWLDGDAGPSIVID